MNISIIKTKIQKVVATISFPCEVSNSLDTGKIHLFSNDKELLKTIGLALTKTKTGVKLWMDNCSGQHKYYLRIDNPDNVIVMAYRDGIKLLREEETYKITE